MRKKILAEMLNGNEYVNEISKELESQAKENNLVVLFGYSDDGIEARGAIYDELGCYNGGDFVIVKKGTHYYGAEDSEDVFLATEDKLISIDDYAPYDVEKYTTITAKWCPKNDDGEIVASWLITADNTPFASFNIMRDGELFCIGCVIDMSEV